MSTQVWYNGFLFPHEYSGEVFAWVLRYVLHLSTHAETETRYRWSTWVLMRKKKPVISNTGKFFCFNNNVSNFYNNSVVEKINGMAYIFTLLVFRKPNKTTINKNKTTTFYRSTSFRFSFILRYFKVFQVPQIFTCGLSDLLLVVFVLRE